MGESIRDGTLVEMFLEILFIFEMETVNDEISENAPANGLKISRVVGTGAKLITSE